MSGRRIAPARRRHQLLGVVFLLVATMFFTGTIGVYAKVFVPFVPVTVRADNVGTQMREGSEVKVHGVVVGEVRELHQSAGPASLKLALQPDTVEMIPGDATARLRPKTLFGERYVELRAPHGSTAEHISAGDVIEQDRTRSSVEVQNVLGELMPLLRTLQPHKVSQTLNAVSRAVDGRGEQLGNTLVRTNEYLRRLEPSLPDLRGVLERMDDVTDAYADAGPDLARSLADLSETSQTIAQHRDDLNALVDTVTATSSNTDALLRANQENLIRLNASARPTAELLARYSPQYPCMLHQFAASIPTAEEAFGKGHELPANRVTIEITGSRGKYEPGTDAPEYNDQRGPRCYPWVERPERFPQYPPGGALEDGSSKPPPPSDETQPGLIPLTTGEQGDAGAATTNPSAAPGGNRSGDPTSSAEPAGDDGHGTGSGSPHLANSPGERRLIQSLMAPRLGEQPADVPEWASALVGPVFRGTEVTVQ